jgi:hypothetical protein
VWVVTNLGKIQDSGMIGNGVGPAAGGAISNAATGLIRAA